MKALLICPSARPAMGLLAERAPLAVLPLLGQSLLEYWLAHLAGSGISEVTVLADDRPGQVLDLVGQGSRWGLSAEVIPESRELTPAEALLKYENKLDTETYPGGISVLDCFPGFARPLFGNYADWFSALLAWMPQANTPDRVGMREMRPGIWVGLNSHIASTAELHAPCWIGANVFIGGHSSIGPQTIIEDRSFVEPNALLAESFLGSDTFVGRFAEIRQSVAWGNDLLNWKSGSYARVPDPFLLCSLRRVPTPETQSWFARVADLYSRNKTEVQLVWKHLLMNKES